jgi:transcriptional regulator GlxA family with amidase domain
MDRRQFLATSASVGGALLLGKRVQAKAIAEGKPLTPPKEGLINVAVAVSEATTFIDFVGPNSAFESWHYDPADGKHHKRFQTYYVSEKSGPVGRLIADFKFEDCPPPHVVLVPAQRGSEALLEWLKAVVGKADVTMSVCVGARHLAKAGLLDGMVATTHSASVDGYIKEFPSVKWVKGMRFVEGEKISTGGGLTAGIDLGLRVVERYFGREQALKVAEHLEYESKGWIV